MMCAHENCPYFKWTMRDENNHPIQGTCLAWSIHCDKRQLEDKHDRELDNNSGEAEVR